MAYRRVTKLESLNCGSRAPKKKRRRRYDHRIVEEIKRLREQYPNLGEKKLYPLLKAYCDTVSLPCPKPATVGRIMKDKGGMRTIPVRVTGTGRVKPYTRQKVLRKPKDLAIERPGHLVALDTVEVIVHGSRRYLITCEDIYSRFAFAFATTSHASQAAEAFFLMWQRVFPYTTTFVLTDNGSEFKKHFAKRLLNLQITHYHTYPRTPKMNAHVERFNRTIQEEFVDFHHGLLLDSDAFNEKLMDWLIFYNTKRVHSAFKNKLTPVGCLLQYEQLEVECKSTCGHTCRNHQLHMTRRETQIAVLFAIFGIVLFLVVNNTYISSPGYTTEEGIAAFSANKPTCYGMDVLLNEKATWVDAPGFSICIGVLK